MSRPDDEEPPVDVVAVRADDELVERLRAGKAPSDEVTRMLKAQRDYAQGPGGPSNEEIIEAFRKQRSQR